MRFVNLVAREAEIKRSAAVEAAMRRHMTAAGFDDFDDEVDIQPRWIQAHALLRAMFLGSHMNLALYEALVDDLNLRRDEAVPKALYYAGLTVGVQAAALFAQAADLIGGPGWFESAKTEIAAEKARWPQTPEQHARELRSVKVARLLAVLRRLQSRRAAVVPPVARLVAIIKRTAARFACAKLVAHRATPLSWRPSLSVLASPVVAVAPPLVRALSISHEGRRSVLSNRSAVAA